MRANAQAAKRVGPRAPAGRPSGRGVDLQSAVSRIFTPPG
jgi:hypothetical protein